MDLEREIARFDREAPQEEAWTPPASWYVEPAMLELERRTVFRRNWLALARAEIVSAPGRYAAGATAGAPWVVLRKPDGALRAFHNVCRHHAAEICSGEGALERLVCPYHGWSYDLDGRLVKAPDVGAIRGFEPGAVRLPQIAVGVLGPYVFGCLGAPDGPLEHELGDVHARLAATGYGRLRHVRALDGVIACNWKVFVDNFLDGGYHVSRLHKGLETELAMREYSSELLRGASVQSCPGRAGERVGPRALYAWVHPNLMLNRYGSFLDVNLVLPLAADRTRVVIDVFAEPGADPDLVERSLASTERIQREDVAICESVQRGLASGSYEAGRYAEREVPMHHFHRLLAADLRHGG